jgi:hypothetical protein
MKDHLSKGEIRKDAVQGAVEAAATTVGDVATILTAAVRDVAGALGNLATEVFELRDAARRANAEHDRPDLHAVDDVEIEREEA